MLSVPKLYSVILQLDRLTAERAGKYNWTHDKTSKRCHVTVSALLDSYCNEILSALGIRRSAVRWSESNSEVDLERFSE